jgi:uncharacterized protein
MKESRPARYQPHRELPATAFLPGLGHAGSRSARPPEVAVPGEEAPSSFAAQDWRLNADYLWGVDLYNNGFFWEAHEAWEAPWRTAEQAGGQRLFLQGLIQCSAACLKARVGQPIAAKRLSERGLIRLTRVQIECGPTYMGLHLGRFVPAFRAFAAQQPIASVHPPVIELASEGATGGHSHWPDAGNRAKNRL